MTTHWLNANAERYGLVLGIALGETLIAVGEGRAIYPQRWPRAGQAWPDGA